jgi:iron complex transport system permease protein
MSAADAAAAPVRSTAGRRRRPKVVVVFVALAVLLLAVSLLAATIGAAGIPLSRLMPALGLGGTADPATIARDQLVLWSIRIPRIATAALIGALLAMSGAVMQGLFRNPLADPALVGVSSGGAFAAAFTIVILDNAIAPNAAANAFELLPLAAFFGSLITTLLLYRIASREGRTSVAIFLLSGLAISALANAGIGLLIFMADDR